MPLRPYIGLKGMPIYLHRFAMSGEVRIAAAITGKALLGFAILPDFAIGLEGLPPTSKTI